MTVMLAERVDEATLTPEDFRTIARIVRDDSGIVLTHAKRELVYSRLGRRMRVLGLDSISSYLGRLDGPGGAAERVQMINAIITNLTGFFREPHHFEVLAEAMARRRPDGDRRLRIWSAGCSSGEEPYTIALTLRRAMPELDRWDARILASDIDTNMVATGAAGRYPAARVEAVPPEFRGSHLRQVDAETVEMGPGLKSLIAFRQLNLLGDWPMRGRFDVIFCRNVVIYFDKPTQCRLFDRFADLLAPDGLLFIGHSETLNNVTDRFRHLGRTVYRRIG